MKTGKSNAGIRDKSKRRAGLLILMLVLSLLASCRATEVSRAGLAGEIDKFPELNSFPTGVVYIGSDDSYHYFRIVKPFVPDRILIVNRAELSLPVVFTVTEHMDQWRWLYGSSSEEAMWGYEELFAMGERHYYIQRQKKGIVLDTPPSIGMMVEAGYGPTAIAFSPSMSSTLYSAYNARYDGLHYLLVVGFPSPEDRKVWMVQTSDPEFVTSEGLKIGDKYEKVMEANAPEKTEIVSLGQCAVLRESGWSACFQGDTLEKSETLRPGPGSKIEWFQKREKLSMTAR